MLTLILVFTVVMLLPIKWAADFTHAGNTGLVVCLLASIAAPVLALFAFRLTGGGFNGFVLGYIALVCTYVVILRVPARSIPGFAVIVLALQIATAMAVLSLGFNVGKLLLGQP